MRKTHYFVVNGYDVLHVETDSGLATIGVHMKAGSIADKEEAPGAAHFLEHMIFKGSRTSSYQKINSELARNGAMANANTDTSGILYYVSCQPSSVKSCSKILCDMFFNPELSKVEMDKERNVVLEEISMYKDNPETFHEDTTTEVLFDWPTGHPILGTVDSIENMSIDDLRNFHGRYCDPSSVRVVCCGPISRKDLSKILSSNLPKGDTYWSKWKKKNHPEPFHEKLIRIAPEPIRPSESMTWINGNVCCVLEKEGITQSSLIGYVQTDICKSTSPREAWALTIVTIALGGDMSSILFDKIREKMGLSYSISANVSCFHPAQNSHVKIMAATDPSKLELLIKTCEKELILLGKNGLTENMYIAAKNVLASSIIAAMETSERTVDIVARNVVFPSDLKTAEACVTDMMKVTRKECNELCKRLFSKKALINDRRLRWSTLRPE